MLPSPADLSSVLCIFLLISAGRHSLPRVERKGLEARTVDTKAQRFLVAGSVIAICAGDARARISCSHCLGASWTIL